MIRAAHRCDIPAILAIWNREIRDGTATFNSVEKSQQDLLDLLEEKAANGQPFWVFDAEQILGFATYGGFRGGVGYRHTAEHSIMLAPQGQGQGIGRAFMAAIEVHAKQAGIHSLWAGVSAENPGAIMFHQKCGFTQVAVLPQVGRKFDRWFDLVLLQKILT